MGEFYPGFFATNYIVAKILELAAIMHRYGGPCDGARDFFSPAPAWTRLFLSCGEPEIGVRKVWG